MAEHIRNILIVHSTAIDWHINEATILCSVIELRNPVVGHVTLDGARGAGGFLSRFIVHGRRKTVAPKDDVRVARDLTRSNDGIKASLNESTRTAHPPVGISIWKGRGKETNGQSISVERKHLDGVYSAERMRRFK